MGNLDVLHNTSTAQAIFEWCAARQRKNDGGRRYLGCSEIGDKCLRRVWYRFRGFQAAEVSGRVARLFDHGHAEEERLVRDMTEAGFDVTGRQQTVSWFGGHLTGHVDGVLPDGCLESGKPHLLEIKTVSGKRFKKLIKDGVEAFDKRYWWQVHLYMCGLSLKRCLFLAVCKDDDEIYQERIHFSLAVADQARRSAVVVITSQEPPRRLSDEPGWWECRWCGFTSFCRDKAIPERSCRACAWARPDIERGGWSCDKSRPVGEPCIHWRPIGMEHVKPAVGW